MTPPRHQQDNQEDPLSLGSTSNASFFEDGQDDFSSVGGSAHKNEAEAELELELDAESMHTSSSTHYRNNGNYNWVVSIIRTCVCLILVLAAILIGVESFRLSQQDQQEQFHKEFETVAWAIVDESTIRVEMLLDRFQTMSTMASTLVASSVRDDQKLSWPYVTLPNLDQWASLPGDKSASVSLGVLVQQDQRQMWSNYSIEHAHQWLAPQDEHHHQQQDIAQYVWKYQQDEEAAEEWATFKKVPDPLGVAAVSWQTTSTTTATAAMEDASTEVNFNELSVPTFANAFDRMQETSHAVLSELLPSTTSSSWLLQPIYDNDRIHKLVGYLRTELTWDAHLLASLLPIGIRNNGIHIVVDDTCHSNTHYKKNSSDAAIITLGLNGPNVTVVGTGDHHEAAFDDMGIEAPFLFGSRDGSNLESCPSYALRIYPSRIYQVSFLEDSQGTTLYSITIGILVTLLSAIVFLVYDWFVRRRQDKLVSSAKRSLAIVHSLFPAVVRGRLLEDNDYNDRRPVMMSSKLASEHVEDVDDTSSSDGHRYSSSKNMRIRTRVTKPIADLFPATTIMFGDIVGFTAWSSVREPSQVFTLLETIYDSLDQIAKRRGVFKVETIGDCYVAVSGLPTPRSDHAVVMSNFARKCVDKMTSVVSELEIILGPGTADLGMRFGVHSGPVMAGVLRGEKSRFQLFGDTMNTAARIEATGAKNKIHLSQETATLLIQAGKQEWVKPRETLVEAKGKGRLQTYWLLDLTRTTSLIPTQINIVANRPRMPRRLSLVTFEQDLSTEKTTPTKKDRLNRLVDYNTQVLVQLLKKVVSMREGQQKSSTRSLSLHTMATIASVGTVMDEVKEVIELPSEPAKFNQDPDPVELNADVVDELHGYVAIVASMYRDNPFHSFDHASHVTMSVTKLLSRVVTPDTIDCTDHNNVKYKAKIASSQLHAYTFGITSSPLTQFAVAFSALIHDLDHQGVPNSQLVKEGAEIAKQYRNQSVAEQNSVDLAWGLLMEPAYARLRQCIFTSEAELNHFRQLVVNSVMATDIIDKELGALRGRRWERVFNLEEEDPGENASKDHDSVNRKATIVIEHLIQASDVAHTMQHWHVYLKWNKRLFKEMYLAYKTGRSDKDPSESWYTGELGFFEHYIIPLARKLKECGVFGVASDEYLDYALANRKEWESKGREVVQDYLSDFESKSVTAVAAAETATKLFSLKSRKASLTRNSK